MVRDRQLDLLRRLHELTPPPLLMGGFAEDALFHGGYSRDHNDVDLLVERADLARLLAQLSELGYDAWTTKGENATGEPFYLERSVNGLLIEIGVTDRNQRDELFLEIARVHYTLASGDPPVGYRVYLPADTYEREETSFEGIPVRCVSPLAAYQLRAGIASRGTFGKLRAVDEVAMEQLRARFFPGASEHELKPRVEPL